MPLGFVLLQDLSHLRKQGRVVSGQALDDIFMNGRFGDAEMAGSSPDSGAGFDDVHSQFAGSFLDGV